MQSAPETLRHRRIRVLLTHAKPFWVASIALNLACMVPAIDNRDIFTHMVPHIGGLLIAAVGLWWVRYSSNRLSVNPFWSPVPWFFVLLAASGVLWGLTGRNGGFSFTIALVHGGLAAIYFGCYVSLSSVVIAATGLTPLPFLLIAGDARLFQQQLPILALLVFIAWQSYRLTLKHLRSQMDAERLTAVLTETQSVLQSQIQRRTAEIENANRQLGMEVELRKEVNQALVKSDEQVKLAMTAAGIGFWDWDMVQRKVHHSDTQLVTAAKSGQVEGSGELIDYVVPDDRAPIRRAFMQHLRGHATYYRVRYRVLPPAATVASWIEDIGKITAWDHHKRPVRMIGTRRDITEDMQLQEELSLSSSLFNNSSDGVFVLGNGLQFRTCNREFCNILQRQKGELSNQSLFQVIKTPEQQLIMKSLRSNGGWSGELALQRQNAEPLPVILTLTAVTRDDGSVAHYLGICRHQFTYEHTDVIANPFSSYDRLTGLFDRNYFHQLLLQFSQHSPLQDNHYAVCVINLDRFKTINESLGLEVGDQLLRDLAIRLKNLADPIRQIARLTSDEFALIIEFEQNRELLAQVLAQLQAEITRPFLITKHELIVTASIGVCIVRPGNLSQLLNHAVAAMNQARHQGGNNYQLYHQKLATSPLERLQLEKAIRKALRNNEFSVNYQPKMNLHTGLIDSVEALVRWQHPQRGIINPQEFIPLAEDAGLIAAIGEQVLAKACLEAAAWRGSGLGDIAISVNLSSHQIRRTDLYDIVHTALHNSQLPAEFLELELTESMLIEDIDHAQDFLNRLKSLGLKLALDDFGTGYSSLNYLKRLPIDTLKIDQSFIAEARSGGGSAIVEAIMAISESLRLTVVAEGVETQEQLTYLQTLGCDYAQGFYISSALPASEVLTLIRHSNLQNIRQAVDSVH